MKIVKRSASDSDDFLLSRYTRTRKRNTVLSDKKGGGTLTPLQKVHLSPRLQEKKDKVLKDNGLK